MRRRLSQDVWVLIALFLFLMVGGYMASRNRSGGRGADLMQVRTTYSSKSGGLKGLYQTLGRLGYPVARHLEPLTTPPQDGILFIVAPISTVSSSEWSALRGWVERGNQLVIVPYTNTALVDEDSTESGSTPVCRSFLSPDVKSFRVNETDRITNKEWGFDSESSFGTPFG